MNKKIVIEPSSDIRRLARQSLKGCWKTGILAVLIMQLVLQVPSIAISSLFPSGAILDIMNVYSILVGAPLTLGLTIVFLDIFRRKRPEPLEIFNGFEFFFKAVALRIVVGFFTFLWMLLFVIPGIIAYYRYSLAYYILADDPTKGVFQCINESKYLMMGNKTKMFCLDFSFFGWSLLCAVPVSIFTMMYVFSNAEDLISSGLTYSQVMVQIQNVPQFAIGSTIAGAGYLILLPYINTASACLYDMINGNLTVCRTTAEQSIETVYPGPGVQGIEGQGTPVSLKKERQQPAESGVSNGGSHSTDDELQ